MPVFLSSIRDRRIKLFPQYGFQKKSFITNIPFLVSFFIGILSALLWMFLILGMEDPISVLGNYFWMPFANILGKVNSITSEKSFLDASSCTCWWSIYSRHAQKVWCLLAMWTATQSIYSGMRSRSRMWSTPLKKFELADGRHKMIPWHSFLLKRS